MFFKKSTGPAEWILACLGNVGREYENTRHNIGFLAAERLIEKNDLRCNRLRFRALTEVIDFGGTKVLLMMPQTYMNNSGEAVGEAARFYKIPPERVIVIYDDIAIPLGKVRVRANGSAGGHNGIKSIIAHLGSDKFPRVKVGVGSPTNPEYDLADWVLGKMPQSDMKLMSDRFDDIAEAAELIVRGEVDLAMNKYSK
jgi:PTH1 family peptidyl-tRNA hydrolase